MLEINNTFLLAGLVIVAVTCIYLLYASFNRPDVTSFKNTINNMVQQNKKRDEIVNFLLDKVQGLNNLVTKLHTTLSPNINVVGGVDTQQFTNTEELYPNGEVLEEEQQETVDDLMSHIDEVMSEEPNTGIQELTEEDLQQLHQMGAETMDTETMNTETMVMNTTNSVEHNAENTTLDDVLAESEFMVEGESEFETVMNIVQNGSVQSSDTQEVEEVVQDVSMNELNVMASEMVEEVVDNALEKVEGPSLSEEDMEFLRGLPQNKDDLASAYNVKDLKDLCKRFDVGTYGRKVELAERILSVLN